MCCAQEKHREELEALHQQQDKLLEKAVRRFAIVWWRCTTDWELSQHLPGFYLGMFWGEDGKGKCALGRGPGLPPKKMLVCLYPSTSSCQCWLAGKSFLNAINLNCNWETFCGEKASPPPPPVDWTLPTSVWVSIWHSQHLTDINFVLRSILGVHYVHCGLYTEIQAELNRYTHTYVITCISMSISLQANEQTILKRHNEHIEDLSKKVVTCSPSKLKQVRVLKYRIEIAFHPDTSGNDACTL